MRISRKKFRAFFLFGEYLYLGLGPKRGHTPDGRRFPAIFFYLGCARHFIFPPFLDAHAYCIRDLCQNKQFFRLSQVVSRLSTIKM